MLAARDGFEVACEISGGTIAAAEVFSRAGRECVIKNTFGRTVTVTDTCGRTSSFEGDTIRFDTVKDGHYIIR